ncbi:MAG TPA: SDR family NAD(P)-dependent oxidoreductase, partial [Steroidobacteraceae bacterium]|nr:SDR family NAD(P)-dependent oxidoreductase [Steroidobacteraceae bacterium]
MTERYRDFAALGAALERGAPLPELMVVSCTSKSTTELQSIHAAAHRALLLLQAWAADERLAQSRLLVITRRAIAARAHEPVLDLAHAALFGLLRSVRAEHPERSLLSLDLDHGGLAAGALARVLGAEEPEIALRDGVLLVPRLIPERQTLLAVPRAAAYRLQVDPGGTLEGLTLVEQSEAETALVAGQVRVAMRAAGLNFRDVYPGEAGPLGMEGAGVVTEVGSGVTQLRPGDRVMGIFPAAFAPVAITDARTIVRMPAEWTYVQGASMPVVFLTAYYGLRDLGRLQRGERVLVHAAAGGVGMAAVQLARHMGAEVFGTASPSKWPSVRALGLDEDHIGSSRTLEFEPRFLRSTQGAGMDVVLDSLAREFVDASLRLLPRGGRFLEMGKTDIRDAELVSRQQPGVQYRAFDLTEAGPERIGQLLGELVELFERGVLTPLPTTSWDIRRAPEAFRHLAQARHVGKVVLTMPRPALGGEGTVLITGGTGTLGALVARHLVREHGVRHLLLCSRQGASAAGAQALQAELSEAGASVSIRACDVAQRDALEQLLASIGPEHPLSAVIHTAGALDDGMLRSL